MHLKLLHCFESVYVCEQNTRMFVHVHIFVCMFVHKHAFPILEQQNDF